MQRRIPSQIPFVRCTAYVRRPFRSIKNLPYYRTYRYEADSTLYMWIYLSGSDGLSQIILYDYQPGRGSRYPQEFLEGFSGMLQCDGYQGYNKVNDVILVCCLAHCRRKFYEAVPSKRRKSWKLLDINSEEAIPEPSIPKDLTFIERELKDLAPEERKAKREEKETAVWEEFWN